MLLLVLLLLSLAAVALAATCRATLRRSAAASSAVADLQHRWGSVSAQYTVLSNAANVLELAEVPGGPPVATLHASFDLGAVRFDVDLCDEQARANVNALLAWRGRTAAEGLVRDLARAGGAHLAPHLPAGGRSPLPSRRATNDDAPSEDVPDRAPPTFGCLTEVFPGVGWDELQPSSPGSLSASLTVYGDGRVNARRASVAVLSAACGPALSPPQIASLSRVARSAGDVFNLQAALAAPGATPDAVNAVQGRLVDGSFTQSVWIEAHDGHRVWRTWAVRDATDTDHPRTFTGQW